MKFTIKNPIHPGWSADPEARYYEGKYIIYVTHSGSYGSQLNQSCLVSTDLENWTLKEGIIDMSGFGWVKRCVWAPTVIEKDGKYYYIFASNDIQNDNEIGGLEIAVSDSPLGPFKAILDKPLIDKFHNGAQPIDAHLFKDDDGSIYLFYGGWHHCNIAKMNDEMTGFVPFEDGEIFKEITPEEYNEAPCMFKKDNKYYFMFSSGVWYDGTYNVKTAIADNPWGPYENIYTILENGDCDFANGPGHNGYFKLDNGEYLMVYHRHDNNIPEGNARFICIDKMDFMEDGKIKPIKMTKEWTYNE